MRRKIITLAVCLFFYSAYSYAGEYTPEDIYSEYDDPGTYSVETMEADNSDSLYAADNGTAVLVCIFDAILNMVENADECDDNRYCELEAVFNMILSIIECSD